LHDRFEVLPEEENEEDEVVSDNDDKLSKEAGAIICKLQTFENFKGSSDSGNGSNDDVTEDLKIEKVCEFK
jgi:hypothetical protein